jgi:hypothetical protein
MASECIITWSLEDIHGYRENAELPEWTDERADRFLASISRLIEDRSIELGWEIIESAMPLGDDEHNPMDLP